MEGEIMEGAMKGAMGSESTTSTSALVSTSASVSTSTSTSTNVSVATNKEKKKREDKFRRRDPRALENIMKNYQAQDETSKLEVLSAKYNELYDDFRNSQNNLLSTEKRSTTLQRERDQLQNEQSKSVLARSRMENLCRELQRQNKLIKEENVAKIREEEERRKEIAAKFQVTLSEVTLMMQESSEKNLRLRDDNIDMANKISALCEQFEKREEQLRKVSKQIELEKQLADAKVAKARIEYEAEKEKFNTEREILIKEKEVIKAMLQKSREECTQLQMHGKSLQDQIQMYMGKYEEFESTICKSTRVFDNFKVEIGKTNKQIITLEKEIKMWKDRYQKTSETICEMTTVINSKENHIATLEKQVDQVTKLCRQIQLERSNYLQILRLNGIDPAFEKKSDELVLPTENGDIQDERKVQKKVKVQKPKLSAKDPLRQKEIKLAQLKEELFYIKKQCENELQKQNANAEETRQIEVKLDAEGSASVPSLPLEIDSNTSLPATLIIEEISDIQVNEQIEEKPIDETMLVESIIVDECQRVVDNNDESVPRQSACEIASSPPLLINLCEVSNVTEVTDNKRLDTMDVSVGSNDEFLTGVTNIEKSAPSTIQTTDPIIDVTDGVIIQSQNSESRLIVQNIPRTEPEPAMQIKLPETSEEQSPMQVEKILLGNILLAQDNQVCESQQITETAIPTPLELEPISNKIEDFKNEIGDISQSSNVSKLQEESQPAVATANEAQGNINIELTESKAREECNECGDCVNIKEKDL